MFGMTAQHNAPTLRMTKRLTLRKRVASACSHCKKSRMRCDDLRPCKRCIRSAKESSCVDSNDASRNKDSDANNSIPVWSGNLSQPSFQSLPHIHSPQLMFPRFNSTSMLPELSARGITLKDNALAQMARELSAGHAMEANVPENLAALMARGNSFQYQTSHSARFESPRLLQQQIANKQEEIRALLSNLQPSAALDTLLLSAMLASPSSAPSSRISAALEAVAAVSSAASLPCCAGGAPPAGFLPLHAAAGPALPPLPPPWMLTPAGAGHLGGPRAAA